MRHLGAVCFVSNRRVAPIFDQQPLLYLDLTVCLRIRELERIRKRREEYLSELLYAFSDSEPHMFPA